MISYKFHSRTALINKPPSGTEKSKRAPRPCQSGWYHNSLLFPNQERVHNPEHANNRCQLSTLCFSKPLHFRMLLFSAWQQGEAQKKIDTPKKSLVDKNFLNSTIDDWILLIVSTKYDKFQEISTFFFFCLNLMSKASQTPKLCYTAMANSIPGSILEQADFPMLCLGHSPPSNLLISSNCLD